MTGQEPVAECPECGQGVPVDGIDRLRAQRDGSLPAMPPEVTEALGWFHSAPEDTNSFLAWLHARYMTDEWGAQKHAATVVRWALSLPGTGERAASEQVDADEVLRSVIRELTHQRDNNYEDSGNFREAFDASIDFVQRALADSSPRSWSLPAQPPDDVTVVHVPAANADLTDARFHRDDDGNWWSDAGYQTWGWSKLLGLGTVVEGEPQAAESPRFERGFYRLARDLDLGRPVKETVPAGAQVAVIRVGGEDCSLWYPGGSGSTWSVPLASLAAAGAVRVEEERA